MPSKIKPIHPGEILAEEFLIPLGISQYRLAKDIAVSPLRVSEIIRGMRSISADTALRLARFFGVSPQFWLNLQTQYELEITEHKIADLLKKNVKIFKTPA